MARNNSNKHTSFLLLLAAFLFIGMFILLLVDRTRVKNELEGMAIVNSKLSGQIRNLEDFRNSTRPAVNAEQGAVYFPEMRLQLPYNQRTGSVYYTTDVAGESGNDDDNLRIKSTMTYSPPGVERQMDCTQLVRLNTKSATPYSPWEELAGSVKLADGRNLYIFAAKAFKNNEASTQECKDMEWSTLSPQQLADEFKEAQSY